MDRIVNEICSLRSRLEGGDADEVGGKERCQARRPVEKTVYLHKLVVCVNFHYFALLWPVCYADPAAANILIIDDSVRCRKIAAK
jgi:hypothetical protein